jgi:Na+/H+-dicarboxylate symporter
MPPAKLKFSLPVQLVFILLFCLLCGQWVPYVVKEGSYAISLSIKELLVFVLPLIIFSFLFSCILGLKRGAATFIFALLVCICFSNLMSTWIAYCVGRIFTHMMNGGISAVSTTRVLKPLWTFALPQWIPNDLALFAGLLSGCLFAYRPSVAVQTLANRLKGISSFILGRLFIPIVPLFIFGFAIKLQEEGTLFQLLKVYGPVFILITTVEIIYISFLFALAARFQFRRWISFLQNVLPATISGFSTMSSAASMPMTLKAAEQNTHRPDVVRAVVPVTVNVHLMGDSISVPLTAFIILGSFGHPFPTLGTYFVFAFYFILAKFAIAGVPGGGIIVMLPVLERYLHFSPEMLSLITALYILFDPINTASNVTGNGAFAILFTQLYSRAFSHPTTRPSSK